MTNRVPLVQSGGQLQELQAGDTLTSGGLQFAKFNSAGTALIGPTGTVPLNAWGSLSGLLSSQTDLQTALTSIINNVARLSPSADFSNASGISSFYVPALLSF